MSDQPKPILHGINYVLPEGTRTKQDLKVVRHGYRGMGEAYDIRSEGPAGHLLRALDSVFKKSGFVAEGLLVDLVWGLQQDKDFKDEWIGPGLTELRMKQYLHYTDAGGTPMTDLDALRVDIVPWVRYGPKLLKILFCTGVKREDPGSK